MSLLSVQMQIQCFASELLSFPSGYISLLPHIVSPSWAKSYLSENLSLGHPWLISCHKWDCCFHSRVPAPVPLVSAEMVCSPDKVERKAPHPPFSLLPRFIQTDLQGPVQITALLPRYLLLT